MSKTVPNTFKEELKAVYRANDKLPKLVEDHAVPDQYLKDHYISLQIAMKNDDNDKKPVELENIFNPINGTPATTKVLITGIAGVGKSSLMHYVTWKWSQEKNSESQPLWSDKFDFVFRLKLKNLLNSPWKDDDDGDKSSGQLFAGFIYSNDASTYRGKGITIEDIRSSLASHTDRTLLLLDGYDESDSITHHTSTSKAKIIFDQILQCKNVIMTSRPNALDTVLASKFDRVIENIGFESQDVDKYIKKYFAMSDGDLSKSDAQEQKAKKDEFKQSLTDFLLHNPQMKETCKIPINASMMCIIWEDADVRTGFQEEINASTLYRNMLYWLGKKYIATSNMVRPGMPSMTDLAPLKLEEKIKLVFNIPEIKFLEEIAYKSFNQERDNKVTDVLLIDTKLDPKYDVLNITNITRYGVLASGVGNEDVSSGSFEKRVGKCADILLKWYGDNLENAVSINSILVPFGLDLTLTKEKIVKVITDRYNQADDRIELFLQEFRATLATNQTIRDNPFENYYTFIHQTFQEYLFARNLKRQLEDNTAFPANPNQTVAQKGAEFIGEHRNDRKYLEVLKFLAGTIANEEKDQRVVEMFWESVTCNLDCEIDLDLNRKVTLLMHLLSQSKTTLVAGNTNYRKTIEAVVDKVLSNNIAELGDEIIQSGYKSLQIKNTIANIILTPESNIGINKALKVAAYIYLNESSSDDTLNKLINRAILLLDDSDWTIKKSAIIFLREAIIAHKCSDSDTTTTIKKIVYLSCQNLDAVKQDAKKVLLQIVALPEQKSKVIDELYKFIDSGAKGAKLANHRLSEMVIAKLMPLEQEQQFISKMINSKSLRCLKDIAKLIPLEQVENFVSAVQASIQDPKSDKDDGRILNAAIALGQLVQTYPDQKDMVLDILMQDKSDPDVYMRYIKTLIQITKILPEEQHIVADKLKILVNYPKHPIQSVALEGLGQIAKVSQVDQEGIIATLIKLVESKNASEIISGAILGLGAVGEILNQQDTRCVVLKLSKLIKGKKYIAAASCKSLGEILIHTKLEQIQELVDTTLALDIIKSLQEQATYSKNSHVLSSAAKALGQASSVLYNIAHIPLQQIIDILQHLLIDNNPYIKCSAANGLGAIAPVASALQIKKMILQFKGMLDKETNQPVLYAIADTLGLICKIIFVIDNDYFENYSVVLELFKNDNYCLRGALSYSISNFVFKLQDVTRGQSVSKLETIEILSHIMEYKHFLELDANSEHEHAQVAKNLLMDIPKVMKLQVSEINDAFVQAVLERFDNLIFMIGIKEGFIIDFLHEVTKNLQKDDYMTEIRQKYITKCIENKIPISFSMKDGDTNIIVDGRAYHVKFASDLAFEKMITTALKMNIVNRLVEQYISHKPVFVNDSKFGFKVAASDIEDKNVLSLAMPQLSKRVLAESEMLGCITLDKWLVSIFSQNVGVDSQFILLETRNIFGYRVIYKIGTDGTAQASHSLYPKDVSREIREAFFGKLLSQLLEYTVESFYMPSSMSMQIQSEAANSLAAPVVGRDDTHKVQTISAGSYTLEFIKRTIHENGIQIGFQTLKSMEDVQMVTQSPATVTMQTLLDLPDSEWLPLYALTELRNSIENCNLSITKIRVQIEHNFKTSQSDRALLEERISAIATKVQSLDNKSVIESITKEMTKLIDDTQCTKDDIDYLEAKIAQLILNSGKSESVATVSFVTKIIYTNDLLNYPKLLQDSLQMFSLDEILNLSQKLNQHLVNEAIASMNSELILGGLISLSDSGYTDHVEVI